MFDWLAKIGGSSQGTEKLRGQFLEMLQDGRHIFDAAANALLGGTDPATIEKDLYATDLRINQTEMSIRKELVVHGSVHGATTLPGLLVLMSVAKDAERIGDYAKNIFDVARTGVKLGDQSVMDGLVEKKDQVSKFLARAHGCFSSQDEAGSRDLLKEIDTFMKACDQEVMDCLTLQGSNPSARALTLRHFKRIASHLGNIVSSVVVPVHELDFFPDKPLSEQ